MNRRQFKREAGMIATHVALLAMGEAIAAGTPEQVAARRHLVESSIEDSADRLVRDERVERAAGELS